MADHIQINDVTPRIQYSANGTQTDFTYPFAVFADADLEVYEDAARKTLTTHYTVSGAGDTGGGTVSFVTAPANGVVVTLRRTIAIQRTSDFQQSGELRASVINDELDTLTAAVQQVADDVARSVRLKPTDPTGSFELPDKATRAGGILGFDANGDPVSYVQSTFQGPAGPAGAPGATGAAGADGADGVDGAAGTDGVDGLFAGTEATVAPAAGDKFALLDVSDTGLPKYATLASITQNLDFAGVTDETAVDAATDTVLIRDASAAAVREMTVADLTASVTATDATARAMAQQARDMAALNAFDILTNTAVPTGAHANGYMWELLTDEFGATSTDEVYQGAGTPDYYDNSPTTYAANFATAYSAVSASTAANGSATPNKGADGIVDHGDPGNQWMAADTNPSGWWKIDMGSGVTKDPGKLRLMNGSNNSVTSCPKTFTIEGSNDDSGWTTVRTVTDYTGYVDNVWSEWTWTPTGTAYRYWRINCSISVGGGNWGFGELELMELSPPANMVVQPPAVPAASEPSTAPATLTGYFLYKDDSGTATLGTDLIGSLSRDDGTTWTAGTFTTVAAYDGTYSLIKVEADVSGQPSGTDPRLKLAVANNKAQRIGPAAIFWD